MKYCLFFPFLSFFISLKAYALVPPPTGVRLSLEKEHESLKTIKEALGQFVEEDKILKFKTDILVEGTLSTKVFCIGFKGVEFRSEFSGVINKMLSFEERKKSLKFLWTKKQFEDCL